MEEAEMIAALTAKGFTVLPPISGPMPIPATGQMWLSRTGECRCIKGTFVSTDGRYIEFWRSGSSGGNVREKSFLDWARKSGARPRS